MTGNNLRKYSSTTVEKCKKACLDEKKFNCRSFDYDLIKRNCLLSDKSKSYSSGVSFFKSDRFVYYERIRLEFDEKEKRENANNQFDTPFHEIDRKAISGWNDKVFRRVSLSECMAACLAETEFFCKSFDYARRIKNCNLSSKK